MKSESLKWEFIKFLQLFRLIQVGGHGKGIKQEEMPISHILNNIEGFKGSHVITQEEKLQLLVENSINCTLDTSLQYFLN